MVPSELNLWYAGCNRAKSSKTFVGTIKLKEKERAPSCLQRKLSIPFRLVKITHWWISHFFRKHVFMANTLTTCHCASQSRWRGKTVVRMCISLWLEVDCVQRWGFWFFYADVFNLRSWVWVWAWAWALASGCPPPLFIQSHSLPCIASLTLLVRKIASSHSYVFIRDTP